MVILWAKIGEDMAGQVADLDALQKSPISGKETKRARRKLVFIALGVVFAVLVYPRVLGDMVLRAADHGNAGQVQFLLRIGANPNSFGWYIPTDQTPLMLAASNGSLPTVRVLLDYGADVNTEVNEWSVTPLMCAVKGGNPAVVQLLIARGANLNDVDGSEDTPLTLARTHHHPEIVRILKSAGAKELPSH